MIMHWNSFPGGPECSWDGAGINLERAETMDAVMDEGTRGKITGDGVWVGNPWSRYTRRDGSRQHGTNPSGETIFIRFGLWLLEACWRIHSQTTKQTEGKENACGWIQMSPYGVAFAFPLMKCVDSAFQG